MVGHECACTNVCQVARNNHFLDCITGTIEGIVAQQVYAIRLTAFRIWYGFRQYIGIVLTTGREHIYGVFWYRYELFWVSCNALKSKRCSDAAELLIKIVVFIVFGNCSSTNINLDVLAVVGNGTANLVIVERGDIQTLWNIAWLNHSIAEECDGVQLITQTKGAISYFGNEVRNGDVR